MREQIKSLPNEFTIDKMIVRLILREKIEEGEKQSLAINTISDKEIEKRFK